MRTQSTAHSPSARRKSATAPDAIALLKADHKKVSDLFAQYEKLGDRAKVAKLKIEEEILYPAARAFLPKQDDLLDEAQVEHNGAKELIAQLDRMQPDEDFFDAKVTVLSEYIKHHVKEEHEEMFPKLRKTELDLQELGMRLAFRKAELKKQVATLG
jgi:hemerythrin HHE cation binding domain-containing protein